MASNGKPVQLHVLHSWGGGVERWVRDYMHADTICNNMVLKSSGVPLFSGQRLALYTDINADEPIHTWDLMPSIHAIAVTHAGYRRVLDEIISNYKVSSILVSSLIGHSLDILDTGLGTAIICHDYYPFCPAINIYFDRICSECGIGDLERCFDGNRYNRFFRLASGCEWVPVRRSFLELIQHYHIMLVAPSDSVRRHLIRLEPAFKDVDFRIIPHGAEFPEDHVELTDETQGAKVAEDNVEPDQGAGETAKLKVLILGRLVFHKGLDFLNEIYKEILDIADIFLLGCGDQGRVFGGIQGINIVAEEYSISDLPKIIRQISPDMGLLLSIWPETFSYTLSELMLLDIPVLAMKVGSFEDRITDGVNGFLVEPDKDAVITKLRELSVQRQLLSNVVRRLKDSSHRSLTDMVNDYHDILKPAVASERPRVSGNNMLLSMSQYESERLQCFQNKTADLFVKLSQAQAEMNPSRAELHKIRAEMHRTHSELQKAHASLQYSNDTIAAMENSKFWKMRNYYQRIKEPLKLFNGSNIRKSVGCIKNQGLKGFINKVREEISNNGPVTVKGIAYSNNYDAWIAQHEPSQRELNMQRKTGFTIEPKISIAVPTFNTPREFLIEMIESVLSQTYNKWELCIADGGSRGPYLKDILTSYALKDERIKVRFLDGNKGIAGNSNGAISLATGDFIALLDHDDLLAPFALFEVVKAINENPEADFIYSDEDKISEDGNCRCDPHFKPDYAPDTLRSYNYICHLSVIRRCLGEAVGWFRYGFDGSQDYDLFLRTLEKAVRVVHLPKILYHWRVSSSSAAGNTSAKTYAYEAAKRALNDHLKRTGTDGEAHFDSSTCTYRIKYACKSTPLVSIVIPNRDHAEDLKRCISSIETSTYRNFIITIVENGSQEKEVFELYEELTKKDNIQVVRWQKPFNYAAINNYAVPFTSGEVLLFLNNDIEVISPDWMEELLGHALRHEIGAVGAKLYYPDDTIQHAGVILGLGGVAGHSHKHFARDSNGYCYRPKIVQNLSAVTAACLMMRRTVFKEIGGFDEKYSHAFNDVDLCLRIRERGYLIVFTPHAELYHYESKSRGYEDTPEKQKRFKGEIELFQQKWKHVLERGDPYYSPNLTLVREDFSIRMKGVR